jgi:hypothetical protein
MLSLGLNCHCYTVEFVNGISVNGVCVNGDARSCVRSNRRVRTRTDFSPNDIVFIGTGRTRDYLRP